MRRLEVDVDRHFVETDYGGSEVLLFRYQRESAQVLVCCTDLSEKILHWARGTASPGYASRYRIFRFHDVADYRRTALDDRWRGVQDDFLITREDHRIPLDDVVVTGAPDTAWHVTIAFERGFGQVDFGCRAASIFELTTWATSDADGSVGHLVDVETGGPFREDQFLSGLYQARG